MKVVHALYIVAREPIEARNARVRVVNYANAIANNVALEISCSIFLLAVLGVHRFLKI